MLTASTVAIPDTKSQGRPFLRNHSVNWPKLLGLFQNGFTIFFDAYVFVMPFYITSASKILCLGQFNSVKLI